MRIGVVSDIHEDVIRLEQSLRLLSKQRVDTVVCLGDIVGYSIPYYGYLKTRNSNKCIELIKASCSDVVIGNHDLFAIRKTPSYAAGFDYGNWYDLDYETRHKLGGEHIFLYEDHELPALLNDESLDYLHALPETVIKKTLEFNILLSHYAYPDLTGSCRQEVDTCQDASKHLDYMAKKNCLIGLSGNDHIPGYKAFTQNTRTHEGFTTGKLLDARTWITGPTVSRGTMPNGVMIIDTSDHTIQAIPLGTELHIPPTCI